MPHRTRIPKLTFSQDTFNGTAGVVEDEDEDEDDEDEGFAPPGEVDPADLPIDGIARELLAEAEAQAEQDLGPIIEELSDPDATNRIKSVTTTTTIAVEATTGMKRKSSTDEDEVEEVVEEESEPKRVKA